MLRLKKEAVRRRIQKTGMSDTQFAHEHGFKQQTLAAWLSGSRNPKRDAIFRLAEALKCQPEEIAEIVCVMDDREETVTDEKNQLIFYWNLLNEAQRESILGVMEVMVKARGK